MDGWSSAGRRVRETCHARFGTGHALGVSQVARVE